MYLLLLFLAHVVFIWNLAHAQSHITQCTAADAAEEGFFLRNIECDTIHTGQTTSREESYSLQYLPRSGTCHLRAFSDQEILTCDNRYADTSGHWVIMIGGSNCFGHFKTLIDRFNVGWNFSDAESKDDVIDDMTAIYDVIWDEDHDVIYTHREMIDAYIKNDDSEAMVWHNISEQNMPPPSTGAFRLTFIFSWLLDDLFPRLSGMIESSHSQWKSAAVDMHIEWSNRWEFRFPSNDPSKDGDGGVQRFISEIEALEDLGLTDFRSLTWTDSPRRCKDGVMKIMTNVEKALSLATISFKTFFWSKHRMILDHEKLTGHCLSDGHSYQAIHHVFIQRYYNTICGQSVSPMSNDTAPVCLDFTNNEQCFFSFWAAEFCPNVDFIDVTLPTFAYSSCDIDGVVSSVNLSPLPHCQNLQMVFEKEKKVDRYFFDVVIYTLSSLCAFYLLYMSWKDATHVVEKQIIQPTRVVISDEEKMTNTNEENEGITELSLPHAVELSSDSPHAQIFELNDEHEHELELEHEHESPQVSEFQYQWFCAPRKAYTLLSVFATVQSRVVDSTSKLIPRY